jgi:hypothetical protein
MSLNSSRFVPVKALMDRLAIMQNVEKIPELIRGLPSAHMMYGWMMSSIEEQLAEDKHRAKMAPSWILYARRPLKEAELLTAIGIEGNASKMDGSSVPDAAGIITSCRGFVKITKVPVTEWSLVDSSAAEYLRQTIHKWHPNAKSLIAECCLAYLGLDVFGEGDCKTDEDLDSRLRDNPFYEYAAQQWGHHLSGITNLSEGAIRSFFLNRDKVSSANQVMGLSKTTSRQPGYSRVIDRQQTGLHLAAQFGLTHVVNFLLTEKRDPAEKDYQGKTLLWLAAEKKHAEVVTKLSGVDRESFTLMIKGKPYSPVDYVLEFAGQIIRDSHFRTALHISTIHKDLDLMQKAVNFGVDINARDINGQTAIQLAIDARETKAIDLLLQNSAMVEGITASTWLEAYGRPSSYIVELSEHDMERKKQIEFVSSDSLSTVGRVSAPYVRRIL